MTTQTLHEREGSGTRVWPRLFSVINSGGWFNLVSGMIMMDPVELYVSEIVMPRAARSEWVTYETKKTEGEGKKSVT